MEICCKTFLKLFCSILRLEGDVSSQKGRIGVHVCFNDKLEDYPSKRGEIGQFSSFSPIFSTCLSLKSGLPTPIKVKLSRIALSFHKVRLF